MTNEKKLELIIDALSIDNDIDENTLLADLDVYDSMSKLGLVILFKDECNKKVTIDDINKFQYIKDIMDFMD